LKTEGHALRRQENGAALDLHRRRVAARFVAVLFIARRPQGRATVSASEILAKSVNQLSAVRRGVEVSMRLVLGSVPKRWCATGWTGIPDQQAIDHDVRALPLRELHADGHMFSSLAERSDRERRVARSVGGQAYGST
jgi:hypothetical protein